ncbi:MAG: hypothetical protein GXP55_06450 [Deltaproteobacteria bacterium]|nr:hypothetical protein [Deltaproteobacteria bacterium]
MDGGADAMVAMAGVSVTPTTGLRTSESGEQATFTIVLDAQPTADVAITLSSSDEGEGTVSPLSVTFTTDNWSAPQIVTITGVDDDIADGDQSYSVVTSDVMSDDTDYSGMVVDDVEVTNTDDETAGITVDPTSGLTTTEMGGSADFTVVLNTAPTADVTIPLSSSDESEGTVSPDSLTFTMDNWSAPQTVTVTGVDDDTVDGDQVYNALTGAATSADAAYDGLDADDVELTNTDDETAGITVDPLTGSTTTEAGGSADITVVLNSAPSADVTIPVSSSDESEGTVSPDSLTFTMDNWNAPQTVTVTGVDDAVADGSQVYQVVFGAATSTDTGYDAVDPDDAEVTNTDDDSAGITVAPVDGLSVSEAGTTDTFTVVLNSRPTADVSIGISSSDDTEGTALPASLTFTFDNWNAPQTVTVTGVDDAVQDGNQVFRIQTAAATSTDTGYDTVDAADVEVTNTDNDSAGVTVTPTSGLVTTEAGGTDTFTVVLNTRPTMDVTFAISSDDTSEGTVAPASLSFTVDNWNAPQTVTVTGVDDSVQDGNQVYNALVGAAASTDANYTGMNPPDVAVSNTDNDSAGVTVTPTSGLVTTEAGGTDTFTVVLNSRPTMDVVFAISSDDTSEGTVGPASLTFTSANWNAAQTVTVTGVDDAVQDGNQLYQALVGAATSTDGNYTGMDPPDVAVSNTDNDSAGITVTPTSGLVTTEAGGTDSFTVVLNSQPTAPVTIPVASSDTGEGTVSTATLTFTVANWNAPQAVTVTGVSDGIFDGDQPYTIALAPATSTDAGYDTMDPTDVGATNMDQDPGVSVTPTAGLITTEAGGTASFDVVLNVAPTANVDIAFASSNTAEGSISPAALTFTTANWNAAQTITVTGVDDFFADGDQSYSITNTGTSSMQPAYDSLPADSVSVINQDDETAGIQLSAPRPRETTEAGGSYVFKLRLRSEPTANVTVPLASSDTGEGTISPSSLTFTSGASGNWGAYQSVTVTGVDDLIADGNQPYTVQILAATSGDGSYNGLDRGDVGMTNIDNETAGFEVLPLSITTREDGTTDSFQVRLRSEPTASVTISVATDDAGEGVADVASLTFSTLNWNSFQTVTVTGVDDVIADGDQTYHIVLGAATSSDSTYAGIDPADVTATNVDDDSPGITVVPTSGLTTSEVGGSAHFDVFLDSQPTANVTIAVSSNDTTEGTVDLASLTFTAANWNAPQRVTVTGVDDFVADGNVGYTLVTAPAVSADSGYNGRNAPDVSATNTDDETAGVTVTPLTGLSVTEAGGTDTFTIVLTSQPTADVTIGLSSADSTEGSVSPASVTFTSANWNGPQTVTVTGVDDALADGDQTFTVTTAAASSSDANYSGFAVDDVVATCVDDETAGVTVTVPNPGNPLNTTETGSTDTFTIKLNSEPFSSVTINLSSDDVSEGTVSPASVTFTAADWNVNQTITVTGVDDFVADGNQPYSIVTSAAVSADAGYSGLAVADVPALNTDNEVPGIEVISNTGLLTNESGSVTGAFRVRLLSQPTAPVTVPFSSADPDEADTIVASIVFNATNWNIYQSVTVTGIDDFIADGNQPFTIDVGPSTSSDSNYVGLMGSSATGVNLDDETPGITVTPRRDLVTSESGTMDAFDVVLNSQPTSNVVITFTWDTSEGSLSASSLTFTSSNWSNSQTVTVTGVPDSIVDGSQAYDVVGDPSGSADALYAAITPFSVRVINIDIN